MRIIPIHHGIVEVCESKVVCPHCTRPMPIEEFEDNWEKSKKMEIRKKCKGCKRFIRISQQINGDFIGYEL